VLSGHAATLRKVTASLGSRATLLAATADVTGSSRMAHEVSESVAARSARLAESFRAAMSPSLSAMALQQMKFAMPPPISMTLAEELNRSIIGRVGAAAMSARLAESFRAPMPSSLSAMALQQMKFAMPPPISMTLAEELKRSVSSSFVAAAQNQKLLEAIRGTPWRLPSTDWARLLLDPEGSALSPRRESSAAVAARPDLVSNEAERWLAGVIDLYRSASTEDQRELEQQGLWLIAHGIAVYIGATTTGVVGGCLAGLFLLALCYSALALVERVAQSSKRES
jgi:hypothetical protein